MISLFPTATGQWSESCSCLGAACNLAFSPCALSCIYIYVLLWTLSHRQHHISFEIETLPNSQLASWAFLYGTAACIAVSMKGAQLNPPFPACPSEGHALKCQSPLIAIPIIVCFTTKHKCRWPMHAHPLAVCIVPLFHGDSFLCRP